MAPARREHVLPKGWQDSTDLAVTATGDSTGFHVLAASARTAYQWRTLATLNEPGMSNDQWIGNACLTSSGKQVIAVYAPRYFTNRDWLFSRGAFAAIIDVKSGAITKLQDQVSLAYYNPGCGADDRVAFTQGVTESRGSTRLRVVNAATKKLGDPVVVREQVTSAIATSSETVAAAGNRLVRVERDGRLTTLATTRSTPFDLRPTVDGGVLYLDASGTDAFVNHYQQGRSRVVASGRLGSVGLRSGADGRVFVVGKAEPNKNLPSKGTLVDAPSAGEVSSEGGVVVESTASSELRRPQPTSQQDTGIHGVSDGTATGSTIDVTAYVPTTRQRVNFELAPGRRRAPKADTGTAPNPRLARLGVTDATVASVPGTVDQGYSCSVPRNDPKTQTYQPHWRQVEWAVDQLVFKNRLQVTRPDNWKGSGVSSWNPQGLFPAPDLAGGGRIPVSVVFGILAQESNLWQAQRHVSEGETGNPLVGNYYGVNVYDQNPGNDWDIDFTKADCGYGITQQTDHMRGAGHVPPGEWSWPEDTQRRVALDYVTNIAAGVVTLAEKWNQIWSDTGGKVIANNGDPSKIENWYFAAWAYNSGWHPKSEAGSHNGNWGVGWTNNPRNPDYPIGRTPFLDNNSYADAARPQQWPYQEKVLGWAAWPIVKTYFDPATQQPKDEGGYNYAWWNSANARSRIVPTYAALKEIVDHNAFCGDENNCDRATADGCRSADRETCWWHAAKTWKTCPDDCGNEAYLRYDQTYAGIERAEPTYNFTSCNTAGLPAGSLIVDDVPRSVPVIRGGGCEQDNKNWTNSGRMTFEFAQDAAGRVPGRADFQQLGNGFGGHYWFGFTRDTAHRGTEMEATGTWELNQALNGWARVLVHVPRRLALSQQAPYEIHLGNGSTKKRYLSQGARTNKWVSLGVYKFAGTPKVKLSNSTYDGNGNTPIAWDAIAFQPLPAKPKHLIAVLGDSYTAGEGAGEYSPESDAAHGTERWNACRRSKNAWARKLVVAGSSTPVGALSDSFDPSVELGFVACSGAQTGNVMDTYFAPDRQYLGEGQFKEINQAGSGVLDENTTLVVLTLGGNDGNAFTLAMTDCSYPVPACNTPEFLAKYKKKADDMIPNLELTLRDIARLAPNAQIVLAGYPKLLSTTVKCNGSLWFDLTEAEALAELVTYANGKQAQLVHTLSTATPPMKVAYADPVPAFVGHGGCDTPEWVNKMVSGPNGDGDFHPGDAASQLCVPTGETCLSRESFHPNRAGTVGYATVVNGVLNAIGYHGS
ncbi:hypothetical protein GCM10010149_78440 [Nonomuraea roseoviolacea subsp. roseoviolacea]